MQEKQELRGAGADIFILMQLKVQKGNYYMTTSLHVTVSSQRCEM